MPSHRETTRRSTARWQIAAVALAGTTAVVLALPMDRLLSPAAPKPAGDGPAAPIGEQPPQAAQLTDVSSPSAALRLLGGERVEPPEPTTPVATNTGDAPTPPTPPTAPAREIARWTYLGSIVGPRSSNALVRIDDRQHIVAEGGGVGSVTLVSVGADHIVLREGETERRVEVQKSQGLMQMPASSTPQPGFRPTTRTPGGVNPAFDARRAAMLRNAGQPEAEMPNLNPQQLQLLRKALGNPAVSERERMRVLEQSGFGPTMPPLDRARRLQALGMPVSADPFVSQAMDQHGISKDSDNDTIVQELERIFGGGS